MASKARQGLNILLRNNFKFEVATIWNQDSAILDNYRHHPEVQARAALVDVTPMDGPWTCVDLFDGTTILRFAIWNRTGNVYRVDEHGAVVGEPIIRVTPL